MNEVIYYLSGGFHQLKALGTEGMIRELMHYLRVAENQFSRSNTFIGTSIYNTVLHSLVKAKEVSSFLIFSIFFLYPHIMFLPHKTPLEWFLGDSIWELKHVTQMMWHKVIGWYVGLSPDWPMQWCYIIWVVVGGHNIIVTDTTLELKKSESDDVA